MSVVIVTGSCGLVGAESVKFFLKKGYDVIGIDNNQRKKFFGKDGDTTGTKKQLLKFTQNEKFRYVTDVVGKFLQFKLKKKTKLKNIIYSKHVAGLTRESVEKTDLRVISKFLRDIKNEQS